MIYIYNRIGIYPKIYKIYINVNETCTPNVSLPAWLPRQFPGTSVEQNGYGQELKL